jgi:hypothetical protein
VAIDDTQDGSPFAVRRDSLATEAAITADRVDFTDDPLADEFPRAFLDSADELVSQDAAVGVIASHQFEIRIANTGSFDLDERFTRCGPRDVDFTDR